MTRCRATTAKGQRCRHPAATGDCGRHQGIPAAGVPTGHTSSVTSDPMAPTPTSAPTQAPHEADGPLSVAARLAARFVGLEPDIVARWADPVGAAAQCTDAAERFHGWAWDNDMDATIRTHHDPVGPVRRPAGWVGRIGHVTVSVRGVTVDFTARQFWPDAPCPLIEPDDEYRARWTSTADRDPQVR